MNVIDNTLLIETLSIPSSSPRQVYEFSVSVPSAAPLRLQTLSSSPEFSVSALSATPLRLPSENGNGLNVNDNINNIENNTRIKKIKKRCCSCCRSPDHYINNCNSIEVNNLLNRIDRNIYELVTVLPEETRLMRIQGIFTQSNLNSLISEKINGWLNNELKNTLIALIYRFNIIHNINYYNVNHSNKVSTNLRIDEIKKIIVRNYLSVVIDVIHYYNGTITSTFKKYVAAKMIKLINNFIVPQYSINYHIDFYHMLRNQFFFNKRMNHRHLLEMIQYIKNDVLFSWYYRCFNEEKKILIDVIENIVGEYIYLKYNVKRNRIMPILLTHTNNDNDNDNVNDIGDERNVDCSVCLENYNKNKELILNCNHSFCGDCIVNIIEKNIEKKSVPPCPLCRTNIVSVKMYDNELYNDFTNRFYR